jgi:hypothetical protein
MKTGNNINGKQSGLIVIGKQKCSENGNCNAVKTGTGIQ